MRKFRNKKRKYKVTVVKWCLHIIDQSQWSSDKEADIVIVRISNHSLCFKVTKFGNNVRS